jgi:hypothetical protein
VPLASYQADCGLIYAAVLPPFASDHRNFEKREEGNKCCGACENVYLLIEGIRTRM